MENESIFGKKIFIKYGTASGVSQVYAHIWGVSAVSIS